jgi:hypothetical protein
MRTTPLVGRKAWFGPKPGAWGWQPCCWQGWVMLFGWSATFLAVLEFRDQSPIAGIAWMVAMATLLIDVCILKGSSPGGAKEYRMFKHQRS